MMKILELMYNFPCEVFISRHYSALSGRNYKIQLVFRHSDPYLSKSASIGQKKISALTMPNFDRMCLIEKIFSLRFLRINLHNNIPGMRIRDRVLLSFFDSLKPDLIHFHFGSLAVIMDWIPQALDIPYTLSLRGSDVQVNTLSSERYRQRLKDSIMRSAGVHCVCEAIWEEACKVCQIDSDQVYHRTIYTTVPIQGKPKEKNTVLNKKDITHFVAIGRFTWHKAYVNLLIGFREFLDKVGPAKLTIIGDGSDRDALLYWIKDLKLGENASLPGKLPYEEFSKILLDCDALVQSSIAEGFSNVTAEAMGMGVPVFATDVGGTREIITDGENGFLLDSHKPQDWWQKLKLVKDKPLMEKIGRNGWVTSKDVFSQKRHAAEFIRFYQDVLSEQ